MKKWFPVSLAIWLALLAGCARDNDDEYEPEYPVWILNVYVWEQTSNPNSRIAVRGCPRIVFHTFTNPHDSTVTCRENNYVKAWNHIDRSFTIIYKVYCDGYYESDESTAYFDLNLAQQREGRPGPEVEVNRDVRLSKIP